MKSLVFSTISNVALIGVVLSNLADQNNNEMCFEILCNEAIE